MGNSNIASVSRRTLLGAGMASLASACASGAAPPLPFPPTGNATLGDAHVHLFNAADLPVAGFVRFVILPEYLPHVPGIALALIDAALTVLKATAPSANAERGGQTAETTPGQFAARFAARIDAASHSAQFGIAPLRPEEDVAHSYAVLSTLLNEADPDIARSARMRGKAFGSGETNREFLSRMAVEGRAAARPDIGLLSAYTSSPLKNMTGAPPRISDDLGAVWDTIKWFYEMLLPRSRHTRDYLKAISDKDHQTDLIVNLLVDYDAWLGDSPSDGSSMLDQLLFWDSYSSAVANRIKIKTFAGYDPLRHAQDRVSGIGQSGYWDKLKACFPAAGSGTRALAQGFKIYPPMGFQVAGNAGHAPASDRSGAIVSERWRKRGWPLDKFGAELDAALDLFFEFCATNHIPVVAHGRDSQAASTGTGASASPKYWYERAQWVATKGLPPLRASIAHWSNTAEFREWMPKILALNRSGASDIYFDIAYTSDILAGNGKQFLQALADLYAPVDPDGKWLMFGSDWIMLGREHGAANYAEEAIAAIRQVPFWKGHERPLLRDNLQRFLAP